MSLLNKFILAIMPLIPKPIVKYVSKRYIAGAYLKDAISIVKNLNQKGLYATIDVLGESTVNKSECLSAVEEYKQILKSIHQEKLRCSVSLKLTQLGLLIDKEFTFKNVLEIVKTAKTFDNFVRIDMEDSSCTRDTIDLFLKVFHEHKNVGIAIQSYLRQSLQDVSTLASLKSNFRLCKGIYNEPHKIAYKDPDIIRNNFALLIEESFKQRCYVGVATHDEKIIWHTLRLIHKYNYTNDDFEFQMLLGVAENLRDLLIDHGYKVRIYVPFGEKWFAYSKRRLNENPKMITYIMKAFFGIK